MADPTEGITHSGSQEKVDLVNIYLGGGVGYTS